MGYKLLALDLDNTLLNNEHELSDSTIKAVQKVKEKGVEVIIATGRMMISALPIIKSLDLTGPMINYNGAYIKNLEDTEPSYHKTIDLDTAKKILEDTEKKGIYIHLYQNDQLFVAERIARTIIYEKVVGVEAREVGRLSKYLIKPPTKLLIIEEAREKKEEYLGFFKEKYGDSVAITESKRSFIEFMAKDVSKAKALQNVCRNLGIDRGEVVAIGDGWNDLEMIIWAGLGIAMDNAAAGVKEKADLIAPHHGEDGVASVLKQVFNLS